MGLEERKEGNRDRITEVTEETSGRDGSVHCPGRAEFSGFTNFTVYILYMCEAYCTPIIPG